MVVLASEAIEADRSYVVAGWASVTEGTEGPAIWDVVEAHIREEGTVRVPQSQSVSINGN